MKHLIWITALVLALPANALPAPPPPPAEMAEIDQFFRALPRQLPADDLGEFETVVTADVIVIRGGEQVHSTRESWFAELRTNPFAGWNSPKPPVGAMIGRDNFYRNADGDIIVRELLSAAAPEGENILYHSAFPVRFVTYTLSKGALVKIDYGDGLDRMAPPASYRDN